MMHRLASLSSVAEFLTDAGRSLGAWVLWMNIWTLALLFAAILLDRLLAKRLSAAWRLGLYLIVFARLALPVEWASPLAWTSSSEAPPTVHYYETLANASVASADMSAETSGTTISAENVSPEFTFSWWMLLSIGYGAVVLALGARWLTARVQLARTLRSTTPADQNLRALARCRRVELHNSFGPAVVGTLRPRIVLPADLARTTPRDTLSTILAHERAHLLRGDHLMAALTQLATIIAWPVLPIWIAAARVRRLMELACDEHALASTGTETRRAYGEQLLALATNARPSFSSPAVGHLGLGGDLPARLRALRTIGARRWPRALQAMLIMLCSLTLIACATHHRAPSLASPGALPETVNYMIEVRVYNAWLKHEKLEFGMQQKARDDDAPPPSIHFSRTKNVLTADEFAAAFADYQQNGAGLVMSPRVMTLPGQEAMISVGVQMEDANEPESGSSTTIRVSPIVGGLRLEAKYTEYGVPIDNEAVQEKSGPISTGMHRMTLHPGETFFTVATGYIGQTMRMVSYTVRAIAPGAEPGDEHAAVNTDERWNVSLVAYDTKIEVPDELLAPKDARFGFQLDGHAVAFGQKVNPEQAEQWRDWLIDHARERMGHKTGYKTLPNLGAMTWDIPHMAYGGQDVEDHSITLGLGRSIDEPVHLLYRARGTTEDDESWQMPLRTGDTLVLLVPLEDDAGMRVILLNRERYDINERVTPQVADEFIRESDGKQIDVIDSGINKSLPPPRVPD